MPWLSLGCQPSGEGGGLCQNSLLGCWNGWGRARAASLWLYFLARRCLQSPGIQRRLWPLIKSRYCFAGTEFRTQPLSNCRVDSVKNLLVVPNSVSLKRGCGIRLENQKNCLGAGTKALIAAFVNCRSAYVNNASFDGYGDLLQKGLGKRKFPPHSGVLGLKMLADGGKNV